MKKRILALTLAVTMLMAGCSGSGTTSADNSSAQQTSGITSSATESADNGNETEESKQESSAPETEASSKNETETTTAVGSVQSGERFDFKYLEELCEYLNCTLTELINIEKDA